MRRKFLCLVFAAMLITSGTALSKKVAPMTEAGVVTSLENGSLCNLDGDGQADDVYLNIATIEDGYAAEFTFAIN